MADNAQEPQIDRETLFAVLRKLAVGALALTEARDLLIVAEGNSLAAGSLAVLVQAVNGIGRELFEALAEIEQIRATVPPYADADPHGDDGDHA